LVLLILLMGGSSAIAAAPVVKDVRLGVHPGKTRLVLDLSRATEFSTFTLANPERLVIDIPNASFAAPPQAIDRNRGLVKDLRFGLYRPDMARLVLDLNGPAKLLRTFVIKAIDGKTIRLVFDLVKSDRKSFLAALKSPRRPSGGGDKAVLKPLPLRERTRPKDGKRVVVIDPGHGGVDPGAIGTSGIYEKQITLSFAKQLRAAIIANTGHKVVMTRNRDVFLKLRERVRQGRLAKGDLFISIHADSIGNRQIRGSGVYTLSERASDKETAALAVKENKADVIAGVDLVAHGSEVAGILIDLTRRETMNFSAGFAEFLVKRLKETGRMRKKPHRFAGFMVLKAPDVPSVLIEIGYLSNRNEEKLLRSRKLRAPMINAIAKSVNDYFKSLKN
jgi:N-acetylmuramoyl-L-alanine amidase